MSHAAAIGRVAFMSPGDFDRHFWRVYHEDFLPLLQAACDPYGMRKWLQRALTKPR